MRTLTRLAVAAACCFAAATAVASDFSVWFWNLDAEEAARAGALTAVGGVDGGANQNPALLPVETKPAAPRAQTLSFPHALRMVSMLIAETGRLPYDAIDSKQKWDDSKLHMAWMAAAVLGIYRVRWQEPRWTLAFLPLREVPSAPGTALSLSTLAAAWRPVPWLALGGALDYWFLARAVAAKPFALNDKEWARDEGWGGTVGLAAESGPWRVGLDYRARPARFFHGVPAAAYPVKADCFSLGAAWTNTAWAVSADLVNVNNRSRTDFLSPRAAARWAFFRRGPDEGAVAAGVFLDESRRAYVTGGLFVQGIMEGFRCKAGVALVLDPSGRGRNGAVFSFDFSN